MTQPTTHRDSLWGTWAESWRDPSYHSMRQQDTHASRRR